MNFQVGDRVEVVGYSEDWDGPGEVTRVRFDNVNVAFDREGPHTLGGFSPEYVRPLERERVVFEADPVIPEKVIHIAFSDKPLLELTKDEARQVFRQLEELI